MRKLPLVLVVALLLLLVGAGVGVAFYLDRHRRSSDVLVLQGNVDVREVGLAFQVPGRIESLAVDEGDAVKAGQVVATLETGYFEDAVHSAEAAAESAKAELARLKNGSRPEEIEQARAMTEERRVAAANARADFTRFAQLMDGGGVSRQAFDAAKAALDRAEAQLKSAQAAQRLSEIGARAEDVEAAAARLSRAQAELADARRRLGDARLIAPGDGIVQTRVREKGSYVNVGEAVFGLTLPKPLWVRAYIAEPDLGAVRQGMEAEIATDSPAGKRYRGHVGFVSPVAEFTPKSVETRELRTDLVYRLRVIVDDADAALKQGMPVTVTLRRSDR